MADLKEENNVFGGVEFDNGNNTGVDTNANNENETMQQPVDAKRNTLPVKRGFWSKFKTFWFQEIDWNKEITVELTPYQQKIEDEINEFLHQEITWKKVHDFLFQEITFGKKKTEV